jgi:hypothetical protein
MSENLVNLYKKQFASNIDLEVQRHSVLQDTVTTDMHQGERASPVDRIGTVVMQQITGRGNPITHQHPTAVRRWVVPTAWDGSSLVDSFDRLKVMTDPQSAMVQSFALAKGRKWDDLIIEAFFAAAATGVDGNSTTNFLSGNVVSVSEGAAAAVGLTVPKLRKAKKILMAHNVNLDIEDLYCVVTAEQHDDLLAEAQVISTDFNDRPVLVDGKITQFLGIKFKHCEGLQTGTDDAAGTSRAVPVYSKFGMHLGKWNDPEPAVDQRIDLQGRPWQVYQQMMGGATRTDEKRVVRIWCRE